MATVYILKSLKDGKKYIGSTVDLKRRLSDHCSGNVESTKNRLPVILVGYRCFGTIKEAAIWEKKYKNSHGQLERDIKNGKINMHQGVA